MALLGGNSDGGAFQALARNLGSAGPLVGAATDLATGGGGGAAVGGAAMFMGDVLGKGRTVPEEHAALTKELRGVDKRYLVIIDDLDRLSANDALLVFKLVKSVGRLPNVIYLMAFDRALTESAVAERFPSEGAQFLEKIIQASFELPPLEARDLQDLLLGNVGRIMGDVEEEELTRFMNVFYDAVVPNIARPRDVMRLANALEVTWSPVAGDVDKADFLAIETLRLFWPQVHRAVYNSKEIICGRRLDFDEHASESDECDALLLSSVAEADRRALRQALMRIFPALERAWSNSVYGADSEHAWRRQRRICVNAHFDSYFRFAVSDHVARATEIEAFIAQSDDDEFVRTTLLQALATARRRGGTRASVLLDELIYRAPQVPAENIIPLVNAIFSVADEMDVEADRAQGFSIGSNRIRIHWLLNRLVGERLSVIDRDAVIEGAARTASFGWLVDIALRCIGQHQPQELERREREPLTSAEAAARLRASALARVEAAAADGSLVDAPDFVSTLFCWRDLIGDGGIERVRGWLADRLVDDGVVIALARSFVSSGWTQTAGDAVARRRTRVNHDSVEALVDPDSFRARITGLLSNPASDANGRDALEAFEAAWSTPRDQF